MSLLTVSFDADSTLFGQSPNFNGEGIDWLAAQRGPDVARQVEELTAGAMGSGTPYPEALQQRLALVQPTEAELAALAEVYYEHREPGVENVLEWLREQNVRPIIISGGFRQALLPPAVQLGFAPEDIFAVSLRHTDGYYQGVDHEDPATEALTRDERGKVNVARWVLGGNPASKILASVGDGGTDAHLRDIDGVSFLQYARVADRPKVRALADRSCFSMAEVQNALQERLARVRKVA